MVPFLVQLEEAHGPHHSQEQHLGYRLQNNISSNILKGKVYGAVIEQRVLSPHSTCLDPMSFATNFETGSLVAVNEGVRRFPFVYTA